MKKLLAISIILICFSSCKKDNPAPAQSISDTDTVKHYYKGVYDIYVKSNYMFPYLTIEKGEKPGVEGIVIAQRNTSGQPTDTAEVHYTLSANVSDRYRVYALAHTISGKMFDSNPVWNRLIISYGTDTIYDKTNSIDGGTPSPSNNFYFDVN